MNATWSFLLQSALIGAGATLVMDAWAWLLKRLFGAPSLNYAMVGRWAAHLPRGRLMHESIAKAAPVAGEAVLGWGVHYLVGVVFAAVLLALAGPDWLRAPTFLPALAWGGVHRGRALSGAAARHGGRLFRFPHAAAQRGAPAQPDGARLLRRGPLHCRLAVFALFGLRPAPSRFFLFPRYRQHDQHPDQR